MQLVEQHRIDRHDPRWKAIDETTFASKSFYNTALYVMCQQFFANQYIFKYAELDVILSPTAQYQSLPRKVVQWGVRQVCTGWDNYKAELVGIRVVTVAENHTSKSSFLDLEPICHHDRYLGKRVKRGLFVSSTGKAINADINGSYNILRRFAPDAFPQGIASCVLHPLPLQLPDRHQERSKQRVRHKASA